MKNYNVFSLGDYRSRVIALTGSVCFLISDIIIRIFDLSFLWERYMNIHVLLHVFIIMGLASAVLSKEKLDDELAQKIRYSSFKLTLNIMIVLGGLIIYILSMLKITSIPLLPVLYFLESALVFNLLFTYYGIRTSPAWILKETTSPKEYNYLLIVLYCIMFFLLLISALINQLLEKV